MDKEPGESVRKNSIRPLFVCVGYLTGESSERLSPFINFDSTPINEIGQDLLLLLWFDSFGTFIMS